MSNKMRILLIAVVIVIFSGCAKENTQDMAWCEDSVTDFNRKG